MFNELSHNAAYNEEALCHTFLQGLNQKIENKILNMAKLPKTLTKLQDCSSLFDLQLSIQQNRGQVLSPQQIFRAPTGTRNNPIAVDCQFI